MRITELTISVGRTINLGNFESLRLEASATAHIDEGDDRAAVRVAMIEEVRAGLNAAHSNFKPKKEQSGG